MKHPTTHRARRPGAFTLLELVLAVAMAAILLASLVPCLRVAIKQKESADAVVEPSRTAAVALEIIRADLENVLPPTGTGLVGAFSSNTLGVSGGSSGISSGASTGTSGTSTGSTSGTANPNDNDPNDVGFLTFYSTSVSNPIDLGDGELRPVDIKQIKIGLVKENNAPTGTLVRRLKNNLLADTQTQGDVSEDQDAEILCRDVISFIVEFWDGSQWTPDWDSTANNNALPLAVRIQIELYRPGWNIRSDDPNASPDGIRFSRVIPLPCAAPLNATDATTGASTTGSSSASGSSSGKSSSGGGK